MDLKLLETPGVHLIEETPRLPSGTHLCGGGNSRLVGGVQLHDFTVSEDGIYICDLTPLGIQVADLQSRGFARKRTPSHSELFIGGRALTLAQYPRRGDFLKISAVDDAVEDGWGDVLGSIETGFSFEDEHTRSWTHTDGLWVHGYWSFDWANSYERVAEIDLSRGWLKTAEPYGNYNHRVGQRFSFLNVRDELKAPGDYYLDIEGNRVLFIPFEGQDVSDVFLSTLAGPVFAFEDAEDITIDGFEITCTRGNGIEGKNSKNITIKNCTIHDVGNTAVLLENCADTLVSDLYVHHTGDGGVNATGGSRKTLEKGNIEIRDCHFHDIATWVRCYAPPVAVSGVGLTVRHNHIHDCPHAAIIYTGNEIHILDNHIYRVVMETGDAGAIYSGYNLTYRGNVVSGNTVHHLGGVGQGAMGIYNDDCLCGTVMENNLFCRVQKAIFLGGGRDFVARGNVFVDCTPPILVDGRGASDHPMWRDQLTNNLHRLYYDVEGVTAGNKPPYIDHYPELQYIDDMFKADRYAKMKPSAIITDNAFASERTIEYNDTALGGQFVEERNERIPYAEVTNRLSGEQAEIWANIDKY